METESVLDKYFVKEESDADNLQSNSFGENEYEEKTYHKWNPIWNETGQNTEESHNEDIKGTALDESYVEVKLETVSDKEVTEDELDKPDFVSLEDVKRTQEGTGYYIQNTLTDNSIVEATSCDTNHDDGSKSKKYKCEKCEYQSNFRKNLLRHTESHKDRSERALFDCATCGATFTAIRSLDQHMLLHMEPKDRPTYSCDECEYTTVRKSYLRNHKLRHAEKIGQAVTNSFYKCKECPYQTKYRRTFRVHEKTHTDLNRCQTCGGSFTTKRSLEQHVLLHMAPKDRPTYNCDMCDFKTIYKDRIKLHQLMHVNRAKFAIPEPETNLRYKCNECSYQTDVAVILKRHKQTHKARSDRNLYECATCGRTYTAKPHLRQHMLLHMDPEKRPTYDCDLCDYKSIYKSRMQKHRAMHFKSEKDEACNIKNENEQSQI